MSKQDTSYYRISVDEPVSRRNLLKAGMTAGAATVAGRYFSSSNKAKAKGSPATPFDVTPFTRDLVIMPNLEESAPFTPGDVFHGVAPEFFTGPDGTGVPADWNLSSLKYFESTMQENIAEIIPGVGTPIFGYEGITPGPTLRGRFGEPMMVRYTNDLPAETSIHAHGGHWPAHSDGYPNFYVLPGKARDYFYPQTAPRHNGVPDFTEFQSTMWYHDHGMDITGHNVAAGLLGFYLVTDDLEEDLIAGNVLPEVDGEFDIPMVFGDQVLNSDGSIFYDFLDHNGRLGDVFVVNGRAQPKLEVQRRKYRFRLLVAATARIHRFELSWGDFLQIGTDSWLLPRAVINSRILLGIAQRADVIIDFTDAPEEVILYNVMEQKDGRGPTGKRLKGNKRIPLVKFVVSGPSDSGDVTVEPLTHLRPNRPISPDEITHTRHFRFDRGNGAWKVNGLFFNPERADAVPALDSAERWILENKSGGWWHPIHIHLEAHQVQLLDGRKPPYERRKKSDTTLLRDNGVAEVFMKFRTFTGPFAFHCHNLEHEDMRMMGVFDPRPEGTTRPLDANGRPKIPLEVSGVPDGSETPFLDANFDHDRLGDPPRDSEIIGEITTP